MNMYGIMGLPECCTTRQTAEALNMPIRTVQDLIKDGRIEAFKVGRQYRVRKDVILSMMGERQKENALDGGTSQAFVRSR